MSTAWTFEYITIIMLVLGMSIQAYVGYQIISEPYEEEENKGENEGGDYEPLIKG